MMVSEPSHPSQWIGTAPAQALSVQRILARYVQVNNIQFTLGADTKLRPEQVFQPECLMPILALEASRIWQFLARRPGSVEEREGDLGVIYERDQNFNSYFPYVAHPPVIGDDLTSTMRMLVFLLAARRILGLKENQTIDLYPYIKQWDSIDWEQAHQDGEIPDIPIPEGFDLNFQMEEFVRLESHGKVSHQDVPEHTEKNPQN